MAKNVKLFESADNVDMAHELEIIAKHDSEFCVDFEKAWRWVGYARKNEAYEVLKSQFNCGTEFFVGTQKTLGQKGGRPVEIIMLTRDCFKSFCMLARTERGKEVRRQYIALEKAWASFRETRVIGKAVRRELTDVIQELGLNDKMHGIAYSAYTNLVYRAVLGMDAKEYRAKTGLPEHSNVREHLTPYQLKAVEKAERLATALADNGYEYAEIKIILTEKLTNVMIQ